jgi:hypothetical protein
MSFAPTIFGPELARILNTLAAVHVEESKRYNRMENLPLMGVFTNPVGTSWFEADMLTRHFYANHASLESLLACDCVPGAREALEWHQGEQAALSMLQTRQMLLARFVEVASSLQAGVGQALPQPAQSAQPGQALPQTVQSGPVQPVQPPAPPVQPPPPPVQPTTRWPLRQHGPLFGMIRQAEHPPPTPAAAPLPMQPWRCPIMVPVSFFNDQGRPWEVLPPPIPLPQPYPSFRMAGTNRGRSPGPGRDGEWEPDPSRASSLAPSLAPSHDSERRRPSPAARTNPGPEAGDAMETGSRPQSPAPSGPPAAPAPPARREPRWLVPRADSVPPTTPGSENCADPRVRLEPPNLTDGAWFSEQTAPDA